MNASPATLATLASTWWDQVPALAAQLAVLVLAVAILDRVLSPRGFLRTRAALWWAVLLRPLFPTQIQVAPALAAWTPARLASPLLGSGGPDASPATAVAARSVDSGGATLALLLLGAWLLVAAALAAALHLRQHHQRRTLLAGTDSAPATVRALAKLCARELGLRRLPILRVDPHARGPLVLGALRPVVVLPATLLQPAQRATLRHALLHELAHVRRRDPLAAWLAQAGQVGLWWHPATWLARRRLEALREQACDRTVVRALRGDTDGYCLALLRLSVPKTSPTADALAFLGPRPHLLARLHQLTRPPARRPRLEALGGAFACALVAYCCVPLTPTMPHPPAASVPSARAAAATVPPLDELEGCLQLRYAVFAAMAPGADSSAPTP